MGNVEGQQRLAAALEESRSIEKEIDNVNRLKDEDDAERFVQRMASTQVPELGDGASEPAV
jgi:hypothetical protein